VRGLTSLGRVVSAALLVALMALGVAAAALAYGWRVP
jgi:hypothetical protein